MTTVEIGTAAELVAFANRVNAGETTLDAKLTADIDMTGVSWTPIGISSRKFAGFFDGGGHTVLGVQGQFMYGDIATATLSSICLRGFIPDSAVSYLGQRLIVSTNIRNSIIDGSETTYQDPAIAQWLSILGGCNLYDTIIRDVEMTLKTQPSITNSLSGQGIVIQNTLLQNISLSSTSTGAGELSATPILRISGTGNVQVFNTIAIDGVRNSNSSSSPVSGYYNRLTNGTGTNLYASDTITSTVRAYDAGNKNSGNGLTVSANLYNDKRFYDGTGIDGTVYLSWDFENTWYWDSTDNLPKLQVFRKGLPLRVKTADGWKNTSAGLVKTAEGWKKATAARTKTSEGWK